MPRKKRGATPPDPLNTNGILWRTGPYIRISREDGHDISDPSYSVQNQAKIINDFVSQHLDEFVIVDTYIDDGFTGLNTERKDFQRLMDDVIAQRINCVIVKDLSRLSRNYVDVSAILEQFTLNLNVRFISLSNPEIDTHRKPEQIDSLELPMYGIMNQFYSKLNSNKINKTFEMKRKRGEFIGAFAPYGYKKNPENKNHLIIDEESAKNVRIIYDLFVNQGYTKGGIAKYLNERSIPSPVQYMRNNGLNYKSPTTTPFANLLWSPSAVSRILANPVYLGHMVQNKQRVKSYKDHSRVAIPKEEWVVVENTHEPIIESDLFERAKKKTEQDFRHYTGHGNPVPGLFTEFLVCNECGYRLAKDNSHGKVSYICRTYKDKGVDYCARHGVKEADLQYIVLQAINYHIDLVESLEALVKVIDKLPGSNIIDSKSIDDTIEKKKKELNRKNSELADIYFDLKHGTLSQNQYVFVKEKLETTIDMLTAEIQSLQKERDSITKGVKSSNEYFKRFTKYKGLTEINHTVLVDLIDEIIVSEDKAKNKKINIVFRFDDEFQRIQRHIEKHNPS